MHNFEQHNAEPLSEGGEGDRSAADPSNALSAPLPPVGWQHDASVDPGRRYPIALPAQLVELFVGSPKFGQLPTQTAGSKAARRRRKGSVKRANALTPKAVRQVEEWISCESRSPASDLLKFRLSLRAGLRAGEIAELRIQDMTAANGMIQDFIEVRTLKQRSNASTRKIEMHDDIREALADVLERHPHATHAAFSIGRGGALRLQQASCVANFFFRLYKRAGLHGCSSHSGRRTFATELARLLPAHQASLRDLQVAMGHARLSSTECYLEPSNEIGRAIRSLGS